uniref:Uncharacterized protein LOC111099587 isoform X2 n=1 Tax=Crassostrea virginica TaxID=6565 RepID=A0A8B8A7K8_CRAVI|nr:uncharacterized protein LOC111099587 isoform X2 [Crassostrea virginica]
MMCYVSLALVHVLFIQTRPVDSFTRPCNASLQTVQRVSECPINHSSYEKAVKRKNCSAQASTVKCHSFQYHCVLSDKMDYLVEVCAPSLNVIGYVCARFSSQYKSIIRVDGLNCTSTNGTNVCPFSYNSTNGYQYPPCYTFVSGEQQPTKDQPQRSDAGGSGAGAAVAVIVTLLIIGIIIVVLVVLYKTNQFGLKDRMQPHIPVIPHLFNCDEPAQATNGLYQHTKKDGIEDSEEKSLLNGDKVPEIPLQVVHPGLCKEDSKDKSIMAEIKFNVKAKTLKDKLLFKCSIMYINTCLQSPSESWTKQNSVRCLNTAAIELQNKEEKDICIDFIEKMEREDSFANDVHKSTLQMFKTVSSVQDKYNGLVEIDVPEGYVTFTFHFSEDENLKTFLGDIHKKDEQLINTFSRIILNSSFLESFNAKPRHLAWNVKEVKIFKDDKLDDERRINLKGDPKDFEENDVPSHP